MTPRNKLSAAEHKSYSTATLLETASQVLDKMWHDGLKINAIFPSYLRTLLEPTFNCFCVRLGDETAIVCSYERGKVKDSRAQCDPVHQRYTKYPRNRYMLELQKF